MPCYLQICVAWIEELDVYFSGFGLVFPFLGAERFAWRFCCYGRSLQRRSSGLDSTTDIFNPYNFWAPQQAANYFRLRIDGQRLSFMWIKFRKSWFKAHVYPFLWNISRPQGAITDSSMDHTYSQMKIITILHLVNI
ncbi:Hypothetical protein CINCED_3A000847 [Cinara cedri]|uniref:Uncharacterized protein n=1 Tax=Cinara cedri TaxID=506608 RepID=A0A5E4N6E0_9HEMI|nr:Hypothetical protein CINCED_3A000847 [Cinara cedri]